MLAETTKAYDLVLAETCGSYYNTILVETIQSHTSTQVETIQSTQFCIRGNHVKHTIQHLQITLQFCALGDSTKPQPHACRDNTKHTILRWWKPYKAHNSTLVETT